MPFPRTLVVATLSLAVAACARNVEVGEGGVAAPSTAPAAATAAPAGQCTALETRPANGAGQQPAFAGQTRTCGVTSDVAFDVTVLARQLDKPWAVEPLPNGDLLVTEKPGRMRIVPAAGGRTGPPIAGLPAVDSRGQGGLLDVALSPSFASDRTLYWSFSEPRGDGNATSVAKGVLSADSRRLENVRVIFRAMPTYDGTMHYGSRLAFGPDGMLYVTLGERSDTVVRPQAQHMNSHMGKILRITPEGQAPRDNPFVGRGDAKPEIWSLGHRNVQAAAFDAQGRLWEIEHGARGGDELNRVEKGKNYGWPIQAYGIEYRGVPIATAATVRPGTEQPVYYWDPVIAPSGAQWYSGTAFPAWRNSLFIGGMNSRRLVRLVVANDKVTGEEHLLVDRAQRIRDVRQGPDGALYVVTDTIAGELWKISPKP